MVRGSKPEGGRRVGSQTRLGTESLKVEDGSLLAGGGDRAGEGGELRKEWTGGLEGLNDSWLEKADRKVKRRV